MRLFVFVLLLALLLDSKELLVIDSPADRLILDAMTPMLEDIARKLGVRIMAIQTAPRRAAAETA